LRSGARQSLLVGLFPHLCARARSSRALSLFLRRGIAILNLTARHVHDDALRSLCAVIPDRLEGTPRRLGGTADRVVVQGPMTTHPALLAVFALSFAWITIATVYLYPGLGVVPACGATRPRTEARRPKVARVS
jgi:hypothetical protein